MACGIERIWGPARRKLKLRRGRATGCRRVFFELLEDRRLLAGLARFDFDTQIPPPEPGPSGWTKVNRLDAVAGLTDPSGVGIKFAAQPSGANLTFIGATIPSDAAGIRNGFIQSGLVTEEVSLNFALTNLDSLKSYQVWVLGSNNGAVAQTQRIGVQGAAGTTTVTQTISPSNLWVNQSVGGSGKLVTDFSPIYVSAPLFDDLDGDGTNESHVVRVSVTKPLGSASAFV